MTQDPWEKDRKLVKRWQNGDDKAFREIYEQNSSKVKDALVQKLRISKELAEEMFQNAMKVLDEKKKTFIVKALLSTFLFEIAKYKSINELRKPSNRPMQNLDELMKTTLDDNGTDISKLGWNKDELETNTFMYETDEEDKILHKALNLLKKKPCKKIFELQYWSELTLKKISLELNRNESYIRRRVGVCEKHLKEIIEKLRSQAQ